MYYSQTDYLVKLFSVEEKVSLLKSLGYTVIKLPETMTYSVYHNSTEQETVMVWSVYKNDLPVHKPHGLNFDEEEWLNDVFLSEITTILKKLIFNYVQPSDSTSPKSC